MRDSYDRFFEVLGISERDFFKFGLSEIIHANPNVAATEWKALKKRFISGSCVFIRGFGRNGKNTHLLEAFYATVFRNCSVAVDPSNNKEPTQVLVRLTGEHKGKGGTLRNYQVSHVFGRTKNPYAFTAPWNVVYIPKIVDPFTGHESKGSRSNQFKAKFQRYIYEQFYELIKDFNKIVTDQALHKRIRSYMSKVQIDADQRGLLQKAVDENFQPIVL